MTSTTSSGHVIIFPSVAECLSDAPDPYRSLMHYLHFLTVPLYAISIYVLVFKTSSSIPVYRKFLLWHTIGNLICEIYISIFMLPASYLPYPLFRGTGVLKYFNISGILQFHLLVSALVHTGISVMEMFKFRFNAVQKENTFNKKFIQLSVIFFYLVAFLLVPIFGFATALDGASVQDGFKQNLWKTTPGISIEVLCPTSVVSVPLEGFLFPAIMFLISLAILTAFTTVPYATITIWINLDRLSKRMSKKTIGMQKMLLISLFIQAAIHGIMLGAPLIVFVYATFFSLNDTKIAYACLLLLSFHGSISTIAMIIFTKPIRLSVFLILSYALRPWFTNFQSKNAPAIDNMKTIFTNRNSFHVPN